MPARSTAAALGPAAALVLVALCLRGPFAAVGPVLDELTAEYALSPAAVAVLTALPLVCFGLLSLLAPTLSARLGLHGAALASTAAVGLGVTARLGGAVGLFAGTVLLSGGIAVLNVLLPALARARYGDRSPAVLGATTAAVIASASLGAGLAQPLAALTGSAGGGLALWALPPLVAVLALALMGVRRGGGSAPERRTRIGPVLADPVGRAVALYFGLQSLSFYAMLTWLPTVLQEDAGVSAATAGLLVAVAAVLGAPAALFLPGRVARSQRQGRWVLAVSLPTAVAQLGLLLAPAAAPTLWTLLYGLGTGVTFPMAMVLFVLRTRDVAQTGRLSAAAQSSGYLLAATGPLVVGLLREVTGGWSVALLVLLLVLGAQSAAGLAAARPRLVTDR